MEKRCDLGDPNDLWVALEVAEDLLAKRMGDLSIDASVLDVAVPEVVGDIFDSATGVEQMDSDRVPEGVDRAPRNPGGLGVVVKHWICRFFKGPSRPVKR